MGFRASAVTAVFVVLPFIVMERVTRRSFHEGFPWALFVLLWLLSLAFILLLRHITRQRRLHVLLRIAGLILIAWAWTGLVLDQMPCFLGVPNCD